MKNYRILKATRERMPEVAKVFRQSFRTVYPNFPEPHSEEEDCAYFYGEVFDNNSVYLAEKISSNKIIGFIAFNSDFINHLYLSPDMQKQG